eukprot:GHVT01006149.1.p1 GENE.GHVT01006149.1~~GHVT01006149.1.p1  ORF type:complete len:420 (-),score=134.48 GHVT01006149.1:615-1874(-)
MDDLRKLLEEEKKKKQSASPSGRGGGRWTSQGALKRQREAELKEEEKRLRAKARRLKEEKLKRFEQFIAPSSKEAEEEAPAAVAVVEAKADALRLHMQTHGPKSDPNWKAEPPIPRVEIFKKLRRLREPVTLFAETDIERFHRLCELEVSLHEDEFSSGQRNAFSDGLAAAGRARVGDDDEEEEDEDLKAFRLAQAARAAREEGQTGRGPAGASADTLEVDASRPLPGQGPTDLQPKGSSCASVGSGAPGGESEPSACMEVKVRHWIRRMLQEWETDLQKRSEDEKNTADGRLRTSLHRQTRKDIKPLTKKLKAKELEVDVLEKLAHMADCCDSRKYKEAHDAYMLLAIGNAAWPMGVTMVGIHERAGRSKIFSSQVAHVLNDETTRKYIQVFKRLMSYCQTRYPANPSQTVQMSTVHV